MRLTMVAWSQYSLLPLCPSLGFLSQTATICTYPLPWMTSCSYADHWWPPLPSSWGLQLVTGHHLSPHLEDCRWSLMSTCPLTLMTSADQNQNIILLSQYKFTRKFGYRWALIYSPWGLLWAHRQSAPRPPLPHKSRQLAANPAIKIHTLN